MIFGRRKRSRAEEEVEEPDVELADAEGGDVDGGDVEAAEAETEEAELDAEDAGGDTAEDEADDLDVETLDATEWRHDGPFEVSELEGTDREGLDDDHPRIDLGSVVIAPAPGSELRLQVDDAQNIVSAMLVLPVAGPATNGSESAVAGTSALEVSAYAAPRSGGLWAELRDEISEAATGAGGTAELAAGPFGVELRRLLPVVAPNGEQGYQPSRMWVAEGPRWLLRGIVYGQAALEADDEDPAVAAVLEAFRSVVVRRGDEAMAPGDLLPMTMPTDLAPVP